MNHQPTSLKPAEFGRSVHSHAVEPGNDYEKDVLNHNYWVHVTNTLKPGDKIEVTDKARTYFAELYVSHVNALGAKVAQISYTVLKENVPAATAETDDPDYLLKNRGPRRWSIIRKTDGVVIKEDIATRDEAVTELATMRSALAA